MKKIGFLSFGHYSSGIGSKTTSAKDVLLQSIDLAVAAEEIGADGAYFRVHHYAQQLGSPFPLLAAIGAKTSTIEIGTGVIDMRYENPLMFAENAAAADLISEGRLELGVSRGSPEQVIDGFRHFGMGAPEGMTMADVARENTETMLKVIDGARFAEPNPRPMFPNAYPGPLGIEPQSPGLRNRIWWGAGSNATAAWAAKAGMNLMSSTLKDHESDEPFHVQQRKQIEVFRDAWKEAGWERTPRVSVSRSIFALTNDEDHRYFGINREQNDQIGRIDSGQAIFGRSYAADPETLIKELAEDEGIAAADTVLLTVPNQLGVAYCVHLLESIAKYVAPALGWKPNTDGPVAGDAR